MNAFRRYFWMIWALLLAVLAACAPTATPQMIGAYPQQPPQLPPAWPSPAGGWSVIDTVAVQVWVEDVPYAVGLAQTVAREAGGETVRIRPLDMEEAVELVLVVPAHQAEAVLRRLRALGDARGLTPQPLVLGREGVEGYAGVTVILRPDPWAAGRAALRVAGAWLTAALPPALMLIGAWTVLRALGRWWSRRVAGGAPVAGDGRLE